jgi:homospermidine synthase
MANNIAEKHVAFSGRLLMLGCGSIGQGVLPLLLRHIDMPKENISVLTSDTRGSAVAQAFGIAEEILVITRDNYRDELAARLAPGDFLLNLSVDISSVALIKLCRSLGVLYLDTCIEPWAGGYTDLSLTPSQRSNYALRETALALMDDAAATTAVIAHGANPGLVSHFVKQALLNLAKDTGVEASVPATRQGWGKLARDFGVKVIHIAERDTQIANTAKQRGEFVNTWSIDGFIGEGCQPAELGWGTHEKALPADGQHHEFGCDAAIYLQRPGASTRVRTWTPMEGPFHGFLITHNEAISIADYFTVTEAGAVTYRPTVHYAYHPCDDAVLSIHELTGKNWEAQKSQRLMQDEIIGGVDELGVLLMGHTRGAYWYGSQLSIEEARALCPHNNATSLQVTAAVLGGVIWAMENPHAGVVEADHISHSRVLEIALPYLGTMAGEYSDWTPLFERGVLFAEDVDATDAWQFKNFRAV